MIDLKPRRPRSSYLRQAALIAAALVVALVCLFLAMERNGSILLLVAADAVLVLACGRLMLGLLEVIGAAAGVAEGIMTILAIGAMVVLIPVIAPVFLVWNLIQAARAAPAPPGP